MTEQRHIETLRNVGLKKTPVRVAVMQHLASTNYALSQTDLEMLLDSRENRVTIYRVLRDLEEKGLIHRVFDREGTAKFALCHQCTPGAHNDNHIHFDCVLCKKIFCLSQASIPKPHLPEGFKVNASKLTIEGICPRCSIL